MCIVHGCTSVHRKGRPIHFHQLPKGEKLREKWIEVCGATKNRKTGYVCSLHFDLNSYERNLKYELLGIELPLKLRKIKDGAVPTLLLPKMEEGKYHYIICILVIMSRITSFPSKVHNVPTYPPHPRHPLPSAPSRHVGGMAC